MVESAQEGALKNLVGDEDIRNTFAAVGEALTRWEDVEQALAALYSVFVGTPFNLATISDFGAHKRIFSDRLVSLEHAARRFFVCKCDQDDEASFKTICRRARSLSEVRNNIAHGTVSEVVYAKDTSCAPPRPIEERRYLLEAPWYVRDRLKLYPRCGLGSREIQEASQPFMELTKTIVDYVHRLHPPASNLA